VKVIIDNSNLFAGGGIQVATSLIHDLNSLKLSHDFHIIQSPHSSKQIDKTVFSSNFHFYDLKEFYKSIICRAKQVRSLENSIKPNVIFTVFGPSYHKSKFPKIVGFAIPYLIYKNSPFFSEITIKEKVYYKLLGAIKRYFFIKNSDVLIFETEDARKIFMNSVQTGLKSFTVNNTLNEVFLNTDNWKDISLKTSSKFNILCLTANYPHKNLKIIPSIIDILINHFEMIEFRFVITCTKDELGFHDRYDKFILYIGNLDILQIPSLYQKIDILFMPTLLEIFSTTYLEAMYMGKPIICSDIGFARYVCGTAAIYCSPLDALSYASNIYKLCNDNDLQVELVENGYRNFKRFGSSIDRTRTYLNIMEQYVQKQ
jgi:glycosyltransferase involved in cell wall biosynthesis